MLEHAFNYYWQTNLSKGSALDKNKHYLCSDLLNNKWGFNGALQNMNLAIIKILLSILPFIKT
jgi:hypothetical protein